MSLPATSVSRYKASTSCDGDWAFVEMTAELARISVGEDLK